MFASLHVSFIPQLPLCLFRKIYSEAYLKGINLCFQKANVLINCFTEEKSLLSVTNSPLSDLCCRVYWPLHPAKLEAIAKGIFAIISSNKAFKKKKIPPKHQSPSFLLLSYHQGKALKSYHADTENHGRIQTNVIEYFPYWNCVIGS